jgi:hypothetical protein
LVLVKVEKEEKVRLLCHVPFLLKLVRNWSKTGIGRTRRKMSVKRLNPLTRLCATEFARGQLVRRRSVAGDAGLHLLATVLNKQ